MALKEKTLCEAKSADAIPAMLDGVKAALKKEKLPFTIVKTDSETVLKKLKASKSAKIVVKCENATASLIVSDGSTKITLSSIDLSKPTNDTETAIAALKKFGVDTGDARQALDKLSMDSHLELSKKEVSPNPKPKPDNKAAIAALKRELVRLNAEIDSHDAANTYDKMVSSKLMPKFLAFATTEHVLENIKFINAVGKTTSRSDDDDIMATYVDDTADPQVNLSGAVARPLKAVPPGQRIDFKPAVQAVKELLTSDTVARFNATSTAQARKDRTQIVTALKNTEDA